MMARNHVLTSLVLTNAGLMVFPSFYTIGTDSYAIFLSGIILGSLFCDVDEEHSYIGRRFQFISLPLNRIIGHRTLTHNIFPYITLLFCAFYYSSNFLLGFGIGAIFHILEDSITNNGVNWAITPLSRKFVLLPKKMRFQTNGNVENFFYSPLITMILAYQTYVLFERFLHEVL